LKEVHLQPQDVVNLV